MSTLKKRVNFFESEEGVQIKHVLQLLTRDNTYNTGSSYSSNTLQYPDNVMPFVDKHMHYLNAHPSLDPEKYLANLRLMIRIR